MTLSRVLCLGVVWFVLSGSLVTAEAPYAPLRVTHCAPYWPAPWATCQRPDPPAVTYCDPFAGLEDGCTWLGRHTNPYGLGGPLAFEVGARYEGDGAVFVTVLGHYLTPDGAVVWTGRTDDGLVLFIPAAAGGIWRRLEP